MKNIITMAVIFVSLFSFSQEYKFKGIVYDEYLEPFVGAIVKLSDGQTTTTDYNGEFNIITTIPFNVSVSYLGYNTEKITVKDSQQEISLILKENAGLNEFVVSASRMPERLFESPVSIERININDIKKTPSVTFYEHLDNYKNIDLKTNSILIKSINTRGFSTIENNRLVQLIDGADNVFPIANLSLGNAAGLVDEDVKDIEILTGASSALYGANAFNGVILINSKSPFEYDGITARFQTGFTSQEAGNHPFYAPSVRAAYKFDKYFAAKVGFSMYSGNEWQAEDYRDKEVGTKIINENSPNKRTGEHYDGVNVYGDEETFNLKAFPFVQFLGATIEASKLQTIEEQLIAVEKANDILDLIATVPNLDISREGYRESDLIDNQVNNTKFNAGIYLRPFGNENFEVSWNSRFNTIKSLFQTKGTKHQLDNAQINQHVINLKGQDFEIRGYLNTADSGDSYAIPELAGKINNTDRDITGGNNSLAWYGNYTGIFTNYIQNISGGIVNLEPFNPLVARQYANKSNINVGSAIYKSTRNRLIQNYFQPYGQGGVRINDRSRVYHADGNFNLSRAIKFAKIIIGGSIRRTVLKTGGTILVDKEKSIHINEQSVYSQIQKSILNDRLKITGSVRYDKSTDYERTYSFRTALGYTIGKGKNQNIRVSLQSAYRQPKAADRFYSSSPYVNTFYIGNSEKGINNFEAVRLDIVSQKTPIIDGNYAFQPGFTAKSFNDFYKIIVSDLDDNSTINDMIGRTVDNYDVLVTTTLKKGLKPEQNRSLEIGYRGILDISSTNILEIDFNAYFNNYKDFIVNKQVYIPYIGKPDSEERNFDKNNFVPTSYDYAIISILAQNYGKFTLPTNTETEINSYGFALSLGTKILDKYNFNASYTFNDYNYDENQDPGFESQFNTPKHAIRVMLGNENIFKNLGFNLAARWSDRHYYQSDFANGYIDARTVLDAQVTLQLPKIKSKLKLGANNLFGEGYYDNIGNGKVGSTYFLTWTVND